MQTIPSGRLEALGPILNRNNLLFPYLRRRVEGRALRAVGPATEEMPTSDGGSQTVITLSGAVAQVVHPPRWPREVRVPRYFVLLLPPLLFLIFALFASSSPSSTLLPHLFIQIYLFCCERI